MREYERGDRRGVEERFIGKSVTFPYAIINEELYVGLLGEGNGNLHAPLSSLGPGKTHFEFEEIIKHRNLFWRRQESKGIQPYKVEPFILEGERMVINAEFAESKSFGAIEAYKLRFRADVMNEVGNAVYREEAVYKINTEELIPVSLEANYVAQCKFYHYSNIFNVSDIVTLAGFARLVNEELFPRMRNEGPSF